MSNQRSLKTCTKVKTINHGDSRRGRKGCSLGLVLVLLGLGAWVARIQASAISAMPPALLSLIAGHSKNKAGAGKKSKAETVRKKSFREAFKKRGADLDNYVYQGSDPAIPKSDRTIPKPALGSHSERTSAVEANGANSC